MLARVLEPEVMDTAAEARDYDAMDHADVNARFCDDFLRFASSEPREALRKVVDFGTGTARIPIALCRRAAGFVVEGIDLAEHMLAVGRANVAKAGLAERVRLACVDAKSTPFEDGAFDATISNSIVHHIPSPEPCLAEMWRVTRRGGVLFVRDLHRPDNDAEVDRLVALYAGAPPADGALARSFENQRALFRASLYAALIVPEVVAMVAPLGIAASAVSMTSDRHWTLAAERP